MDLGNDPNNIYVYHMDKVYQILDDQYIFYIYFHQGKDKLFLVDQKYQQNNKTMYH